MATIMLDDYIPETELEKHREKYSLIKSPTEDDQFQLALNLIRAKNKSFVEEGLQMFQSLFSKTKVDDLKRDVLYYMAIAETKLGNYEKALKYCQTILNVQSNNDQVKELHTEVTRRMKKDALIGAGIVGGAAMAGVFGIIALGATLFVKKK
jgi:mitochondrial fission 1 protein